MKYLDEYRNPELSRRLVDEIRRLATRPRTITRTSPASEISITPSDSRTSAVLFLAGSPAGEPAIGKDPGGPPEISITIGTRSGNAEAQVSRRHVYNNPRLTP